MTNISVQNKYSKSNPSSTAEIEATSEKRFYAIFQNAIPEQNIAKNTRLAFTG